MIFLECHVTAGGHKGRGGDAMVGKVITTVLIIPRPESTNEKGR